MIEFQLTLNGWLEWKRKDLSPRRLFLLRAAETLLLPLTLLLGVSLILVFLRLLNIAPSVTGTVPPWSPIVVLVLLASARILRSLFPSLSYGELKREWNKDVANVKCSVNVTENGFDYELGDSTYKPTWPEVAEVFQTKQLLIFCDEGEYALLIPKRAFVSKTELEEFLELAYKKTVLERQSC